MEIPKEWSFQDKDVAENFDEHVHAQLPWYDDATQVVGHFVKHFLPQQGLMYDLGCSNGNIGRACADTLTRRHANLVAVDSSQQMTSRYRGPGEVITGDIAELELVPFDVAVAFLSLSFLPVRNRATLLGRLYEMMRPGGVILVFDKFHVSPDDVGRAMQQLTLVGKLTQGVSAEQVVEKELSLAGVMRPLMPLGAPEIWRRGEFAGYAITTPPEL